MKTSYFLSLCIILAAAGVCVTSSVHLTHPSKSYKSTSHVQYLTQKPCRPYKVIAVIKGKGSPHRKQSAVVKKVRKKARKAGAQAIYTLNSNVSYTPPTYSNPNNNPNNPFGSAVDHIVDSGGYEYDVKVAAVRYIDPEKEGRHHQPLVKTSPPKPGCR